MRYKTLYDILSMIQLLLTSTGGRARRRKQLRRVLVACKRNRAERNVERCRIVFFIEFVCVMACCDGK